MKWLSGNQTTIINQLHTTYSAKQSEETLTSVKKIIEAVRTEGDLAARRFSEQFDGFAPENFRVPQEKLTEAKNLIEPDLLEALEKAKANIQSFHEKQKRTAFMDSEKAGVIRGQLVLPLETVGVYVPGGTAAYPSSVLMNVLPAKIAGVKRIIMVTPPDRNGLSSSLLAAASLSGVDEVYQIGGAQAIAALAYGTETIPQVDKIVGPGNIFVATAKKEVFGQVAIDMIAGPSEIAVLADRDASPAFIAADLLSQAEHDTMARTYLVTDSVELARQVEQEIDRQLPALPRQEIAAKSLADFGHLIVTDSQEAIFEVANAIAPEHLEIQMTDPMSHLAKIRHAGSIFLGPYASEPLGDYMAGPNHVLPTSGTARFFSPLGVDDFVKRSSFLSYTKEALAAEKDFITRIAEAEGLHAHAEAIRIRFKEEEK
ncbi:histidinol dehydrogenase [Listeria costaricensis]|uniref:histidinol dehydrogenase n=1 Tax=Listeria costaricensis TaxID=2026604 RepID=UPI000C06F671|nr:histidinol dehydrogenase [Listeria costaricensis]